MASRILLSRTPFLTRTLARPYAPVRFHLPRQPLLLRPPIRHAATIAPQQPQTLSARLKHLSREYGYSALGVYLGLSALDFPFCFLAVRYFGADRIGAVEKTVVEFVKPYWVSLRTAIGYPPKQAVLATSETEEQSRWNEVEEAEREVEKSASMFHTLAFPNIWDERY